MLKKLVHLKNNIYYSPLHNSFFELESTDDVDYSDFLFEIKGDEEKIFEYLMYNPNQYVSKRTLEKEFKECSDPYDGSLDRLCRRIKTNKVELKGLIKKTQGKVIISLMNSPFSVNEPTTDTEIPLLYQTEYYVDYDEILSDFAGCASDKTHSLLHKWIDDCEKLSSYDERCLMLLKCIGFLPAFSQKADKLWFIEKATKLCYRFDKTDINNYGGTDMLIFARSVISAALEYIKAQLDIIIPQNSNKDLSEVFSKLLGTFLSIPIPGKIPTNPLLLVAYYHYTGLVYYRNYLYTHLDDQLKEAKRAMDKALLYAAKVDMHLQIWRSFLTYNLGRVYSELDEPNEAIQNIQIAVNLRLSLFNSPFFSEAVKHDLCFEYLLARIVETDIRRKFEKLREDEAIDEYLEIKHEAEKEYGSENSDSSYSYIFRLLNDRLASNAVSLN